MTQIDLANLRGICPNTVPAMTRFTIHNSDKAADYILSISVHNINKVCQYQVNSKDAASTHHYGSPLRLVVALYGARWLTLLVLLRILNEVLAFKAITNLDVV